MNLRFALFCSFLAVMITGCGPGYRYKRLMEKELAKGVRYDTLFLGIYLGMPEKEFYTHCWQLNKQGLIRQGSGNTSVYYRLTDLKDTIEMNFYPNFYKEKIWRMPVKFNYLSWAPWNSSLDADSLEMNLVDQFRVWYGPGFHKVLNANKEIAFYKIDGNRLISIFKEDETYVWAIFTDLTVYNEIQKLKENKKDSVAAASDPTRF